MSSEIREFLDRIYFSNTVGDYLWFIGMMILAILFKRVISKYLSNLFYNIIEKYTEGIHKEKLFELLHKPISAFIIILITYIATSHIEFPQEWGIKPVDQFGLRMVLQKGYVAVLIIAITWIFLRMVEFGSLILLKRAEKTESKEDDQIVAFAREFAKIIVIIISFFLLLGGVFNVDIGAIIAGLGIGGLALALAAKESIENLLASFTIFFDKPFVVGDFVKVGTIEGTVEKVGFRSTRLRTLEKSFLTIPNKKMVDSELDNLTLRTFRRGRFNIGVVYGTTPEQIKAIVTDIQAFIDEHPRTNQEGRVSFTEFGSSSLDIMIQYFVDTMDWNIFLEVKQEINFKIMEIVKNHHSDFAFPTTTVHLQKNQ